MSSYHRPTWGLLIFLWLIGLSPASQAVKSQKNDDSGWAPQQYDRASGSKEQKRSDRDDSHRQPPQKHDKQPVKKQHQQREQPRKDRVQTPSPARHDRNGHVQPRDDRYRTPPPVRRDGNTHTQPRDDRNRTRSTLPDQRGLWPYPNRSTPPVRTPRERSSHDRHYERYSIKHRAARHYHNHETYRYHTHYLAPIHHHYHPIGYHVRVLPRSYIRIYVGGYPYFYVGGVFYRSYVSGYVVVRAPVGAFVEVLPIGFIEFSLGGVIYYYVNDTYYIWDDYRQHYVVVEKPDGAERAIAEATSGRLFVYPNEGQSEEQQAKDRYECHRWAVHETDVDPTLEDEEDTSPRDRDEYKRALTACLEGRGYTVK